MPTRRSLLPSALLAAALAAPLPLGCPPSGDDATSPEAEGDSACTLRPVEATIAQGQEARVDMVIEPPCDDSVHAYEPDYTVDGSTITVFARWWDDGGGDDDGTCCGVTRPTLVIPDLAAGTYTVVSACPRAPTDCVEGETGWVTSFTLTVQ